MAKGLLTVSQRQVPCYSVPFPNELVMNAMKSSRLTLVSNGYPVALPNEAVIGVSSFGFTGSNAHVIVKGLPDFRRSTISVERVTAQPVAKTCTLESINPVKLSEICDVSEEGVCSENDNDSTSPGISCSAAQISRVISVCNELGLDIDEKDLDVNVSVLDMGLDSLGVAELS